MQFKYNFFYKTPLMLRDISLLSDPNTVVMLENDENNGKTFKEIYGFTDEEVMEFVTRAKWIQVREYRDAELKASDWTQVADVPSSIQEPWAVYRDALRNLPQQFTDPDDVIFPDKP